MGSRVSHYKGPSYHLPNRPFYGPCAQIQKAIFHTSTFEIFSLMNIELVPIAFAYSFSALQKRDWNIDKSVP